MDSSLLKELTIREVFGTLTHEHQLRLLEQLLRDTDKINIEIQFELPYKKTLYNFCCKRWKQMSIKFFNRFLIRWQFLMDKSIGNESISCAEIGDLYLQAYKFDLDEAFYPFLSNDKTRFFWEDIPTECNWQYMFISKKEPEDKWCTNFLISDLMELDEPEYEAKLKEYKFV
jgi:hypothetical protein